MLIKESDIDELDVVQLKDGRECTILEIFQIEGDKPDYLVEFSDGETDLAEISFDQVGKVIWKLKSN
ncbi:MAG: DUF4926 domain-containing protein [Syntrophomonadaceae bacterium]|nr:DUF4926 domain-containing protein [Syntrophomonadaceae bacterium]